MADSDITIENETVVIRNLTVRDRGVIDLLRSQPSDRHGELLDRALAVGARGLVSMGLGIDLAQVDDQVRRSIVEASTEAQRQIQSVMQATEKAFEDRFSPERRTSLVAQALHEFATWRDEFLSDFDPSAVDSVTGRFLEQLDGMVGPNGLLEDRLKAALDPDADGSGLSKLARTIDQRLTDLRDVIMRQDGRAEEAEVGTQKGFVFEDRVEQWLRESAATIGGCVVDRTGRSSGELSADSLVGDFVVTLPDRRVIVIEAKNVARISLNGRDGILEELDRAAANRKADFAICVSARPAFPKEVGVFGLYGRRLLITESGDGTLTNVGLRWALAAVAAGKVESGSIDSELLNDRLERIRSLAQTLSSNRRSLTQIATSVESVRSSLEAVRAELLASISDVANEIGRTGEVVSLHPIPEAAS